MDNLSKAKRSFNMSLIKSKDTNPEKIVRRILHKAGFRFRLYKKDLPGRPDIVLPRYRTAIFVHGCFWHQHKNCKRAFIPKSNKKFWREKFIRNIARDKQALKALRKDKWKVIVVWECEVTGLNKLADKLKRGIHNI